MILNSEQLVKPTIVSEQRKEFTIDIMNFGLIIHDHCERDSRLVTHELTGAYES